MPEHTSIAAMLAFLERHGYVVIFLWVFAEQSALPLPSGPLLLAAGALIRTGKLSAAATIGCCVAPALLADCIWFGLGRYFGRRVLRLVCRVSLEPDSCVKQTENRFVKYGMSALLVSKFVPGLNTVAAPLAGQSKKSLLHFALFDVAGILFWCGAYLACGYIFSHELEAIAARALRLGSGLVIVVAALLVIWIGRKFRQRRRLLKELDVARITPEELRQRLAAGEDVFIIDLRGRLIEEGASIPNALRLTPGELEGRRHEIPSGREIVLVCS